MIERQQKQKAEHEWQVAIAEFATRNNAIVDWEVDIPRRGNDGPFSVDVSKALIRSNGQPIVVLMDLSDVVEKGDRYAASFSGLELHGNYFDLRLELMCTADQAKKFLDTSNRGSSRFAVVARIDRVSRAKLALKGDWDEGAAFVSEDYSPNAFLATGTCVDALAKRSAGGL